MKLQKNAMIIGIIAIIAGIIILIQPAILAWIVAVFLIIYGILALLGKT